MWFSIIFFSAILSALPRAGDTPPLALFILLIFKIYFSLSVLGYTSPKHFYYKMTNELNYSVLKSARQHQVYLWIGFCVDTLLMLGKDLPERIQPRH